MRRRRINSCVVWLVSRIPRCTLAKDETLIRSQDYLKALTYISWNPTGNALVWKYIPGEWPALVERFGLYDYPRL